MIPQYILLALFSMFMIGIADFVYGSAVRKGITPAITDCPPFFGVGCQAKTSFGLKSGS